MLFSRQKTTMVTPETALPGRDTRSVHRAPDALRARDASRPRDER